MKYFLKKIALLVPPLRNLYEFSITQSQGYSEASKKLLIAEAKISELNSKYSELNSKYSELKHKCELQELQSYVMRSDLHRAAVRNETLSKHLADLQDKYDRSRTVEALTDEIVLRLNAVAEEFPKCAAAENATLAKILADLSKKEND